MQINGIARQLLAPLQLDSASPSTGAAVTTTRSDKQSDDMSIGTLGPGFHEILSHYDISNITPREFSNLVQELHDAGEIDDADFRELSRIRLELEQGGVGSDEPIDLVDFLEDKLRDQTADFEAARRKSTSEDAPTLDESTFTTETKRQLEWVRKFALVHAAGADGVDVGA